MKKTAFLVLIFAMITPAYGFIYSGAMDNAALAKNDNYLAVVSKSIKFFTFSDASAQFNMAHLVVDSKEYPNWHYRITYGTSTYMISSEASKIYGFGLKYDLFQDVLWLTNIAILCDIDCLNYGSNNVFNNDIMIQIDKKLDFLPMILDICYGSAPLEANNFKQSGIVTSFGIKYFLNDLFSASVKADSFTSGSSDAEDYGIYDNISMTSYALGINF